MSVVQCFGPKLWNSPLDDIIPAVGTTSNVTMGKEFTGSIGRPW